MAVLGPSCSLLNLSSAANVRHSKEGTADISQHCTDWAVQETGKSKLCLGALPNFRKGSYGRCALQSKIQLESIPL